MITTRRPAKIEPKKPGIDLHRLRPEQLELFGEGAPHWINVNDKLPKPGQWVMTIHRSNIFRLPVVGCGVPVNECCGDRSNPFYGSVDHGLCWWAELPDTPIKVMESA